MLDILADRDRKFPNKKPNRGSVFKSNPTMYTEVETTVAVFERYGFKGMRIGGPQVSKHHANLIVNTISAMARDVLKLIEQIGTTVEHATGYRMEAEVCYVTPEGLILPADRVGRQVDYFKQHI